MITIFLFHVLRIWSVVSHRWGNKTKIVRPSIWWSRSAATISGRKLNREKNRKKYLFRKRNIFIAFYSRSNAHKQYLFSIITWFLFNHYVRVVSLIYYIECFERVGFMFCFYRQNRSWNTDFVWGNWNLKRIFKVDAIRGWLLI